MSTQIIEKLQEFNLKTEAEVKGVKENLETQIKSLEDKLAKAEETSKKSIENIEKIEEAINNGFKSVSEKKSKSFLVEKDVLEKVSKALLSKSVVELNDTELKAIRFSDASTTGDFSNAPVKYGEIETNKQALANILQDIDILPAIPKNNGDVAWDGFDESLVDIYDANEMDSAQLSEAVKLSEIKFNLQENKAKMIISSRVIQDPSQIGVLDRNLEALNRRYQRKLASKVYNDIITGANLGNISKFSSTTNDAPADAQAREDLRTFITNLKVQYVDNSVIYISRKFLNALFSKEVSDGHLPTEQFVANANNGINSFFTTEKNIPIRVFEHAQIGNYKSLNDGTTTITADYVNGGENTGKLLAFIGDLKLSYKMVPSQFGSIGYDSSFGHLINGSIPAGVIGYTAQGVVAKEAIKVLYGK